MSMTRFVWHAIEVLMEWRELFKRGVPVRIFIESKLAAWSKVSGNVI